MSRATNQKIAAGLAQGLQNFVEGYTKRKNRESAQAVLDDPNSSAVQKALAWESIAQGTGYKAYDSILKEQELRKQERIENEIDAELYGRKTPVEEIGQRAGVGNLEVPQLTPVQLAQQQAAFPGYQGFMQQELQPQEEMQQEAMPEQQEGISPGQEPIQEQATGLANVPTDKIINALGKTKNKEKARQLQAELKRRNDADKAQARRDAAQITAGADKFEKDRSYAERDNKDYKKRIESIRASSGKTGRAIDLGQKAVRTGDVGAFSLNNLANITGIDAFKNASGAALDVAIKQHLIGTVSEVSAKAANLFLERNILDSFAKIGQNKITNLIKLEALDTERKLDDLELQVYDTISRQDREQFGYEQPALSQRVSDALKPLQKDILKASSWRIARYLDESKSYNDLKKSALENVPSGTPLTEKMGRVLLDQVGKSGNAEQDENNAIALAERLGYTIYSPEEIARYEF